MLALEDQIRRLALDALLPVEVQHPQVVAGLLFLHQELVLPSALGDREQAEGPERMARLKSTPKKVDQVVCALQRDHLPGGVERDARLHRASLSTLWLAFLQDTHSNLTSPGRQGEFRPATGNREPAHPGTGGVARSLTPPSIMISSSAGEIHRSAWPARECSAMFASVTRLLVPGTSDPNIGQRHNPSPQDPTHSSDGLL